MAKLAKHRSKRLFLYDMTQHTPTRLRSFFKHNLHKGLRYKFFLTPAVTPWGKYKHKMHTIYMPLHKYIPFSMQPKTRVCGLSGDRSISMV